MTKEQEPVAWMCSDPALIRMEYKKFSNAPNSIWNIPLYTHPQPKVEQEPVKLVKYNCICGKIMKFESDQGVVAPKREWVDLNEYEIFEIANFCKGQNISFLAKELSTKLKEKNT